tara:strand:- start:15190 stop:15861 length:672 start_codon:yes stop_codon:yes gene_type:complete
MHLLIAAAGSGRRMGASRNKILLEVCGMPLISWTVKAAISAKSISWIGIIGQPKEKEIIMDHLKNYSVSINWIDGGVTRQESVENGLRGLPPEAKYVLIHDGARCLVTPNLFDECSNEVLKGNAVVAATPVVDTIKKIDHNGFITGTPKRNELWAAQTPQGFLVSRLKEGHKLAVKNGWVVTDDSSLFEQLQWPVKVLKSESSNIKITTPFDLEIAEVVLSNR